MPRNQTIEELYAIGVYQRLCGSSRRRCSPPRFGDTWPTSSIGSYRSALMLRSEQGPVIRGSGGLRKVWWAAPGGGKRGGLRVIYYWAPIEQVIYTLFVYSKSEQGDLTAEQTRQLGRWVREEFK